MQSQYEAEREFWLAVYRLLIGFAEALKKYKVDHLPVAQAKPKPQTQTHMPT